MMRPLKVLATIFALSILLFANSAAAEIEVLWLGQSTTRITSETGKVIVIDPFLTKNPKAPSEFRDLKALGKVDLILVTHGHQDHAADLLPLARLTGAKVVANYEFINNLVSLGALEGNNAISMGVGGYVEPLGRGIKIHMVPAEHSSSIDLRSLGIDNSMSKRFRHIEGGAAAGYVVELENGFKIYHSGDTAVFGDMALIHALHKPDLALLCIGGKFTMDPVSAAYAIKKLIKPKQVIPIHYGTYPVINRTPAELKKALGNSMVKILDVLPGTPVKF